MFFFLVINNHVHSHRYLQLLYLRVWLHYYFLHYRLEMERASVWNSWITPPPPPPPLPPPSPPLPTKCSWELIPQSTARAVPAAIEMANTTNEDDIILIDYIRRNRVLYDNTHDRHKDNTFKDSIWYDISVKTGKSGKDMIYTWSQLLLIVNKCLIVLLISNHYNII